MELIANIVFIVSIVACWLAGGYCDFRASELGRSYTQHWRWKMLGRQFAGAAQGAGIVYLAVVLF